MGCKKNQARTHFCWLVGTAGLRLGILPLDIAQLQLEFGIRLDDRLPKLAKQILEEGVLVLQVLHKGEGSIALAFSMSTSIPDPTGVATPFAGAHRRQTAD